MNTKTLLIIFTIALTQGCFSQKATVSGIATDTSKGVNAIEIVINDTLSKIMKDPKKGRNLYLRLYQNSKYVVRTDSTGVFKINAYPTDSLYFKSYQHKTEVYLVRDLLSQKKILISLKPD